jgi:hypothetical protein
LEFRGVNEHDGSKQRDGRAAGYKGDEVHAKSIHDGDGVAQRCLRSGWGIGKSAFRTQRTKDALTPAAGSLNEFRSTAKSLNSPTYSL